MTKDCDKEIIPKDDPVLVKAIVNEVWKNRRPTAW